MKNWLFKTAVFVFAFALFLSFSSPFEFKAQILNAQPIVISPSHKGQSKIGQGKNKDYVQWDVIYLHGKKVGYRILKTRLDTLEKQQVRIVGSTDHLTFKRFGQTTRMETRSENIESLSGALISFKQEILDNGKTSSVTTGRVDGNELTTLIRASGKTQTRKIPWKDGLLSSAAVDQLIEQQDWSNKSSFQCEAYFSEVQRIGTVKVTRMGNFQTPWFDGTRKEFLQLRSTNSVLPGMSITLSLNKNGRIVRSSSPILGGKIVSYRVAESEALKSIQGKELDIAVNTQIHPSNRLLQGLKTKEATYLIHWKEGDPSRVFPESNGQSIKVIDKNSIHLSVKSIPIPSISQSNIEQNQYLKSTMLINASDTNVIAHSRRASVGTTRPGELARLMENYVYRTIRKKNFSTALSNAAEVAKNLEGDCTEHAVLLAAMLRAQKIPARVAVGFVYIENDRAFGGHMWTEAWLDGQWVPLDATLGRGGIGAAHIKLNHSKVDEESANPASLFLPVMSLTGKVDMTILKQK